MLRRASETSLLPPLESDGPICPVDKPPAYRRVTVGGIEDRLFEVQDADTEILAEGLHEDIMLPTRLIAAECPLVERCIRLKQPKEHLDPGTVDGHRPKRLPFRSHTHYHLTHHLRREATA